MAGFINILLSLSVSGTFLTLILILLKPLYKKKASQKWQYYIWLVVIIRLLFPFTINFNITGNTKQAENYFPETLLTEKPEETEQLKNIQEINTSGKENTTVNKNKQVNVLWILEKLQASSRQNLFYIWLIIAIAIFIRKVTVYQNFNKYLKAGASEINSLAIWEITGILVEKYHIRTNVNIYINNMVSSPLLTGFFKPCIILPSEKLEETDLHNIISHELIHFKRKDMFYKWLVQFTACIHWFNPFIYLIIHETSRLCELSCDEAIIKNLDSKERKEYGNTLLNMADSRKKLKTPGMSVTLNEGWQLLKERLDKIMEFKKKTLSCTVISAVLAFLLCVTAAAAGTPVIDKTDGHIQLTRDNTNNNIENTNTRNASKGRKEKQYNAIKKFISEGKVVFEDGDYHILYGGVDEKDMSSGGVSDGCIGIVLDEPDGYVGIGPVSLKKLDAIVDEAAGTCKYYLKNKRITQKKADLIIGLARLLKDKNGKIDAIKDLSVSKEYKKWKITSENGNFYYNKKRVRILADFRADKSFVQFSYDEKGVIDLKITRNKKGKISKIEYLSKKEAEELLDDWG
ncbi:MAG: hypothetical protein HFH68_10050 [Lachnospiraceae bacterium]|nr:hypothetical protein [Lachnospiraceae bacterium]